MQICNAVINYGQVWKHNNRTFDQYRTSLGEPIKMNFVDLNLEVLLPLTLFSFKNTLK